MSFFDKASFISTIKKQLPQAAPVQPEAAQGKMKKKEAKSQARNNKRKRNVHSDNIAYHSNCRLTNPRFKREQLKL